MDQLTELLTKQHFPNGIEISPLDDGTFFVKTMYKKKLYWDCREDILEALLNVRDQVKDAPMKIPVTYIEQTDVLVPNPIFPGHYTWKPF